MTGRGHRALGLAVGVALLPFVEPLTGFVGGALVVAGAWLGSTAPDWLEIRLSHGPGGSGTIIRHRTLTHVLLFWIFLCFFSGCLIFLPGRAVEGCALYGFALGGVSHWIGDVGTPMGVPVWHPFRRISVRLWSSESEMVPVALAWAGVGLIYALTL